MSEKEITTGLIDMPTKGKEYYFDPKKRKANMIEEIARRRRQIEEHEVFIKDVLEELKALEKADTDSSEKPPGK